MQEKCLLTREDVGYQTNTSSEPGSTLRMPASSHVLDRIDVTFDDDHAVANAWLIVPATLLGRLRLEAVVDEFVSTGYRPGRNVATVAHGILAGTECIDDLGVLRAGAT